MTGVSGMFLVLPIMAVLKIIFDRTEQFEKWDVLLGDERPAKKTMRMQLSGAEKNKIMKKWIPNFFAQLWGAFKATCNPERIQLLNKQKSHDT